MIKEIQALIEKENIKGFLAQDEADYLYYAAAQQSALGPCLELGSYCGLSTLYLGSACKQHHNTLYALDHHRGSEEHQLGEEYHDPELYDVQQQCMDSFRAFRRSLALGKLEDTVVPLVCSSALARRHWATPLSLVFIDGGHSEAMAKADCLGWSQHLCHNGLLLIHDIFEKPEQGGQGPWMAMQSVLESGNFEFIEKVNSLGVLRCKNT